MKNYVLIECGYSKGICCEVNADTGTMLNALGGSRRVTQNYINGKYQWKFDSAEDGSDPVKVLFVSSEALIPPSELLIEVTAAASKAEKKWLDEYTKRTAVENELEELKKKVAALNKGAEESAPATEASF